LQETNKNSKILLENSLKWSLTLHCYTLYRKNNLFLYQSANIESFRINFHDNSNSSS